MTFLKLVKDADLAVGLDHSLAASLDLDGKLARLIGKSRPTTLQQQRVPFRFEQLGDARLRLLNDRPLRAPQPCGLGIDSGALLLEDLFGLERLGQPGAQLVAMLLAESAENGKAKAEHEAEGPEARGRKSG